MKTFVYNLDGGNFESQTDKAEIGSLVAMGEEFKISVYTEQEDGIKEKLTELKQMYPNASIGLDLYLNKDYIEEESEMQTLANIDKFCLDKDMRFNINLINEESQMSDARYASGTYQNLLIARNRVEKLKQRLQDFTYEENGQQVKLSPYEKFLIVYKAVANNEYNMSQNYDDDRMRNWIGALSSDKIICSGFSSLLKCICNRVFTPEELKCYNQSVVFYDNDGKYVMSHANNMVMINDPKYNLSGLYYADACADCKAEARDNQTAFDYCLIPIQQAVELKDMQLTFDKQWFVYKDIGTFYNNASEVSNSGPNDIMRRFGYKSKQEFIDKADKIIAQRREQVELNNQQLRQQIEQRFEEFAKNAKFKNANEFKSALPILRSISWSMDITKKNSDIIQATSFLNNITELDDLNNPKVIADAQKYRKFYLKYSKKIDKLNDELLQYAETNNIPINSEMSEYGQMVEYIFCKNQEKFNEYDERDRLDAEIDSRYEQQIDRCIQKGKDVIYAPPIDDKKFAKGLVAMLRFVGYEEDKIKGWVSAEVEKRRAYQQQHFGSIESILQEQNNVDQETFGV